MSNEIYDDDEQPLVSIPGNTGQNVEGEVKLKYINRKSVTTEETDLYVLLELTGEKPDESKRGVDIVAVLDISGSMKNIDDKASNQTRLQKLKIAMKFLIQKLGPNDRLSIVTFSTYAKKKSNLLLMTAEAKKKMEAEVTKLELEKSTRIDRGLEKALDVLKGRRYTEQRPPAIMLMSDGEPDKGSPDAAAIPTGGVPVHTFGVSGDFTSTVLNEIARNSNGGTFSISNVAGTKNTNDMSLAFAQCLAGLQSIAVNDLNLTIAPAESKIGKEFVIKPTIVNVFQGDIYKKDEDKATGSVTISFGNLYAFETRNVLVKLRLPAVDRDMGHDVLRVTYTYSDLGDLLEGLPETVPIDRTTGYEDGERDEVIVEQTRLNIIQEVRTAREEAERKLYEEAKERIRNARNSLDLEAIKRVADPNKVIEGLRNDLDQMLELMEDYEKKGRHFLNSFLTSHDLQRAAARGDMEKIRAFATKVMDKYVQQVNEFKKNPDSPFPIIAQALSEHLGKAIDSLKNIEESLAAMSKLLMQSP